MRSIAAISRFNKVMTPPIAEISAFANELERQGKSIIHCTGQGIPYISPPDYALEVISDQILKDPSIHSYSPDPGFLEVREAVSSYLSDDFSIETNPESLFLTAGSNMAFFMLITALLEPGHTEVLFSSPYYFNHVMAVQIAGGKPIIARSSNGLELDSATIASEVTKKTRAIISVSPNNPSGAVFSKKTFEKLSGIFEEHNDIVLISDEAYANFVYGQNQHCSPASLPNLRDFTCTLGSCSKAFGVAGWRLGWFQLPPVLDKLHGTLLKIQDTTNIAPPSISQRLLLAILQGPYKNYLKGTRKLLEKNWLVATEWKQSLSDESEIEIPQSPEGAFYLFPKIKSCKDSITLSKELLQETGVVTVPGIAFGEESYLRISYAGRLEKVQEALQRFEKFLRNRKGKK
ncbi:MAG: pyridoxal phosphate-dependent aminotransferase [Candidatus Heimdallarchaeota archaeon]